MTTRHHNAFDLIRSHTINALNVEVTEYRHRATGAQHIHIASEQIENVFMVALRTVPTNSTGVAHMLEHTALCGSERYPVRDPFFMMIRRSLNTFMNAFTSSDWTAYPFASQNKKDFNNLLGVYLDAVFFSRLDPLDFAQEGHRLEFADPNDSNSELVYKGVVFNEMKGAMSSAVSVLYDVLYKYVYPSTTYHYNSGGDPEHITDLSYDELKQFYQKHYHPSNAVFMTYGDIPVVEHQTQFEELVLKRFEKSDAIISVSNEKRYYAPLSVEENFAIPATEPLEHKTHIVLSWLLDRTDDLDSKLQAHLLANVLLENSASPLRKALETCELGSAPSPLCGLDDSHLEMCFMAGIEGSEPEHAAQVESLILNTLTDVAEHGVPLEEVEAILHQLELSQREVGGDGYPYGLQIMLGGMSAAIHRNDIIASMDLEPALDRLREAIKNTDFIPNLAKRLLLNNPHRVRLTLKPDQLINERKEQAEKNHLAAIKATLTEQQKQDIIDQAAALAQRQAQEDNEALLPKVGLQDVPSDIHIPEKEDSSANCAYPTSYYAQGTNGLVYQQVIIDLPAFTDELLAILPLYTNCFSELGCRDKDYLTVQSWQSRISGGVSAYNTVRGSIDDVQSTSGHFTLSSKALAKNHQALCELIEATLEGLRFDELQRIREIVAQERTQQEQSVTGQGHSLIMGAAASGMSPASALSYRLSGLKGIQSLKTLDDSLNEKAPLQALADQFKQIHSLILQSARQFLLVGEKTKQSQFESELASTWQTVTANKKQSERFAPFSIPATNKKVQLVWVGNTQVNFCAKAYPTVAPNHLDAAPLSVLGAYLRNGFLHRTIREQGGAYGGGASHNSNIAAFQFYSYRDPRMQETLADFDRSIDWLLNGKKEVRFLEEAILSIVSDIDKPSSPAGEAKQAFHNNLYGRSSVYRKEFRQRVLNVTFDDLTRVAEQYLKPENASTAILTHRAMWEQSPIPGFDLEEL